MRHALLVTTALVGLMSAGPSNATVISTYPRWVAMWFLQLVVVSILPERPV